MSEFNINNIENFNNINMSEEKNKPTWSPTWLGLAIYGLTIVSAIFFKVFEIPFWILSAVFAGTILIFSVFGAFELRKNKQLSEKNFLELMLMVFKKIPGLNLLFKNKNNSQVAETKDNK